MRRGLPSVLSLTTLVEGLPARGAAEIEVVGMFTAGLWCFFIFLPREELTWAGSSSPEDILAFYGSSLSLSIPFSGIG